VESALKSLIEPMAWRGVFRLRRVRGALIRPLQSQAKTHFIGAITEILSNPFEKLRSTELTDLRGKGVGIIHCGKFGGLEAGFLGGVRAEILDKGMHN
jgi:hypothetical protein